MNNFKTIAGLAAVALVLPAAVSAQNGGAPLTATLSGANEVPGPGDDDGAGIASVTVNLGQKRVCYTLNVSKIEPARMAHIHEANAGMNGPVVINLTPPTSGSSQGCATVTAELAKSLIQEPETYYVNVHNQAFPGGALRGQLGR